jgi:hypothetical protein
MPRFLIEAQHESDPLACARVVRVFLATGSHYLTHVDWGCADGEHTAWLVVEVDSKEQARAILPAAFRAQAKIVALNKFTIEYVDEVIRMHQR